jgi:two-component system response regulator AtoC
MNFFFGSTDRLQELESKAGRIARSCVPILIEGETGTGKERLARHLHELRAAGGLLVKFLCDSSPSAVFGGLDHGQEAAKRLAEASQDTVLLKRIDRLPVSVQERILLLLDDLSSSVPFFSTASSPIERMAAEGRFLPELLYRISVYRISMPPLRERRRDIPDLFRLMLEEISPTAVTVPMPDSRAMKALMEYSWPGNLRELQNVVRGYLLAPDSIALGAEIERRRRTVPDKAAGRHPSALKEQVRQVAKRVEGQMILDALEQHRWNRRRTAEALSISYRSLMYKMKNCNIRSESDGGRTAS